MKIATTPLCQEVLKLAGVSEFIVTRKPGSIGADLVVVLSETAVFSETEPGETSSKFLKIKLNTFSQIENSIRMVSDAIGSEPLDYSLREPSDFIIGDENRKIKVKVYSNFLKDIVNDLGFLVVPEEGDGHDFLVYPDYLKDEIVDEIKSAGSKAVEVPSHGNAPTNPLERAEMRYKILERSLCMKL
jgi:hypothetical protein